MIRIEVIARALQAAEDLAEALASAESIEVLRARTLGAAPFRASALTDVIVALDVPPGQFLADGPPLVMLSADLGRHVSSAIHALLPLNSSPAEIAAAIAAAANGLYVLTRNQFRSWQAGLRGGLNDSGVSPEKLTPRELQVLAMMADGLANKEIAAALNISGNTVKFHVAQVLAKLGVASRTEAVRVGIRRGHVAI